MIRYEEGGWEWDDEGKRKEMSTPTSRFLVVTDQSDKRIALVHFEFCLEDTNLQEDQIAAIYCLEIQVEAEWTGKGIGAHLMSLLESIGQKFGMRKCMLTVLKNNHGAIKFYTTKLGYTLDDTDPSLHLVKHKQKKIPYKILKKLL